MRALWVQNMAPKGIGTAHALLTSSLATMKALLCVLCVLFVSASAFATHEQIYETLRLPDDFVPYVYPIPCSIANFTTRHANGSIEFNWPFHFSVGQLVGIPPSMIDQLWGSKPTKIMDEHVKPELISEETLQRYQTLETWLCLFVSRSETRYDQGLDLLSEMSLARWLRAYDETDKTRYQLFESFSDHWIYLFLRQSERLIQRWRQKDSLLIAAIIEFVRINTKPREMVPLKMMTKVQNGVTYMSHAQIMSAIDAQTDREDEAALRVCEHVDGDDNDDDL